MASRLDREFDEAQFHFDRATAPILAEHHARRREMMAYAGSPQWKREREVLDAQWKERTAPARALLEKTEAEIAEHGEMSEETDRAWAEIMPRPALMLEAAE